MSVFAKRDDCRIYTLAYKPTPYKLPDNALYTTLHCGAALHDYHFGIPDNLGTENISRYNNVYCDLSGSFWIWRNHPTTLDYIGQMQYSKQIRFKPDTDFGKIFKEYDAICAKPIHTALGGVPISVRRQFTIWHPKEIIDMAEDIIKTDFPEYYEAWDKYVNNDSVIYYSAGYVLRTQDYEEWCRLFFGVCDKIIERYGATKDTIFNVFKKKFDSGEWENKFIGRGDNYHCLIFGFLGERIFTAFVRNLGKIKEVEYKFMGRV